MGGGVNPIEWVLPPLAISHTIADQAASASGTPLPGAPGSPAAAAKKQQDDAEAARQAMLGQQAAQRTSAASDLAARTETPQEAIDARRRAQISAERLGGGKRRASQTLTDPGMTLSGSYT